jgi:hypothetical protein
MKGTIYLDKKSEQPKLQSSPKGETDEIDIWTNSDSSTPLARADSDLLKKWKPSWDQPIQAGRDLPNNPNSQLSQPIYTFIERYQQALKKEAQEIAYPIHVDQLTSKMARLYEKARRIIDWKEEHLVRRTAIERNLKRRLISEISGITILTELNPNKMAEPLVMELMRGGYFSSGQISKEKLPYVEKILAKYVFILKNGPLSNGGSKANIKKRVQFYNWILEIAACELEELLASAEKENALMDLMTTILTNRIRITSGDLQTIKITKDELFVQTYIATHRTLFNLDSPIISYHLLDIKYPKFKNPSKQDLADLANSIVDIWTDIEDTLNSKYKGDFFKIADKQDAAYLILGDVFKEMSQTSTNSLAKAISNEAALNTTIDLVYNKRLSTLKSRLLRSAIYSTLSIFVAGGVSLLIFEGPIAKLLYGKFSLVALAADLLIPTALMFFLVTMIKPPSKNNLEQIKKTIKRIIYPAPATDVYEMNLTERKQKLKNTVFGITYILGGTISMGFIYWIFKIAGVPWSSLYIDTINVAVVVFAATVIKHRSKEITMEEEGNFVEFVLDFFSIPLAKLGLWFASKWKEYNFVSVFFTTLVDTPFSTFIEVTEDWRNFLKKKRSEIH